MPTPGEVTLLLERAKDGDRPAVSQLFRMVSKELRAIAGNLMKNERQGHVLQPTALVNELYLRLFAGQKLEARVSGQFFAIAARVMRQVLIDQARRRDARKRHGEHVPIDDQLTPVTVDADRTAMLILALRRLSRADPRMARSFDLAYFAGRTPEEIASQLHLNVRMIQRDLKLAKLWLQREMGADVDVPGKVGTR